MNSARHEQVVEAAQKALVSIRGVRSVVLFGSAARGMATEGSDVDLLIDCEEGSEDEVRRALYNLSDRFGIPLSPSFFHEEERAHLDTQFLESILRHGRPLIGGLPTLTPQDLDLQPLRLVSYRTDELSPRDRARLLRVLDGYRTEKTIGRKRYAMEKRGFLAAVGGWRVGRGALVVPEEAAEELDAVFRRFGATRSMVPVWAQRP